MKLINISKGKLYNLLFYITKKIFFFHVIFQYLLAYGMRPLKEYPRVYVAFELALLQPGIVQIEKVKSVLTLWQGCAGKEWKPKTQVTKDRNVRKGKKEAWGKGVWDNCRGWS